MGGPGLPIANPTPYRKGNKLIVPRSRQILDLMDQFGTRQDSQEADMWSDLLYRDPAQETDVAPTVRVGDEYVSRDFSDLLSDDQKTFGFRGNREYLEELRAQNQGASGRAINALSKFIPGTAVKFGQDAAYATTWLGDTFAEYLTGEDPKSRFKNQAVNTLEDWDQALREWAPIHQRQSYKDAGLVGTFFSSEFWAGEVAEGLEFLASMGVTGKALQVTSKAMGLGAKSELALTAGISAAGEAGFEAKGVYDNIKRDLSGRKNPTTGEPFTDEEVENMATAAANRTFNANLLVVGLGNAFQLYSLSKYAFSKNIDRIKSDIVLGKASAETVKASREAFKGGAAGFFSEGLFEENVQSSVAMVEEDMAKQGISDFEKSTYFNKWLDGVVGFGKSAVGMDITEDQKEQMRAILAGGIIGAPTSAVQGHKEGVRQQELYGEVGKHWDDYKKSRGVAYKNFFEDNNSIYKDFEVEVDELDENQKPTGKKIKQSTKINPKTGQMELDVDKAARMYYQSIWNKSIFDRNLAYTLEGNKDLVDYNRELALAGLAYNTYQQMKKSDWRKAAMSKTDKFKETFGFDIDSNSVLEGRLEQESIEGLSQDELQEIEQMKGRTKEYKNLWISIDKKYSSKDDTSVNKSEREFSQDYKKILYYNNVKLRAFQEMLNGDITDKQRENLDKAVEDTQEFINHLENNRDKYKKSFFAEFKPIESQKQVIADLGAKLSKTEDPEKIKELTNQILQEEYRLKELQHIESDFNPMSITQRRTDVSKLRFGSRDNLYYEMGMRHTTDAEIDKKMIEIRGLKDELEEAEKQGRDDIQNLRNGYYDKLGDTLDFIHSKKGFLSKSSDINSLIDSIETEKQEREELTKELQNKLGDIQDTISEIQEEYSDDLEILNLYKNAVEVLLEGLTIVEKQLPLTTDNEQLKESLKDAIEKNQSEEDFSNDLVMNSFSALVQNKHLLDEGSIDTLETSAIAAMLEIDDEIADSMEFEEASLDEKLAILQQTFDAPLDENAIEAQDKISEQEELADEVVVQLNELGTDTIQWNNRVASKLPKAREAQYERAKNATITKGKVGERDNILRGDFLNLTLDKVEGEMDSYEANPDFYTGTVNLGELKTNLTVAKTLEEKNPNRHLLLDVEKGSKDTIKVIDDALAKLEFLIEKEKEAEGTRAKKLKEIERKEAESTVAIIGLSLDGEVVSPNIFNLIEAVVTNAKEIFGRAKEDNVLKTAAVNIILDLFKTKATDIQRNDLNELLTLELNTTKTQVEEEMKAQDIPLGEAYFGNPVGHFKSNLMSSAIQTFAREYTGELESKNPLFIFDETRDINELRNNVDNSKLINKEEKENILKLIDLHQEYLQKFNGLASVKSDKLFHKNHEKETQLFLDLANEKSKEVPTSEQLGVIRSFISKLSVPVVGVGKKALSTAWTMLVGPAGSGKTKIVLNWVSKLYDVPAEKIYAFSHKESSSNGIATSTKGIQGSLDNFLNPDTNLSQFDLIVIDEMPFFTNPEIESLEKRVSDHNKTRQDNPLRVVALGDPGQIRKDKGARLSNLTTLTYMNYVDPLTIVYRTNVKPIVDLMNFYRRKTNVVSNRKLTANVLFGTKFDPDKPTIGTHAGRVQSDLFTAIKANEESGRSKVIIVNTIEDKGSYTSYAPLTNMMNKVAADGKPLLEVLTYDEAQGETFGEVYIDLNKSGKDLRGEEFLSKRSDLEFNTAMYTAISRARDYVFVLDPTMENLMPDSTMTADKTKLQKELDANFTELSVRFKKEEDLISEYIDGYTPANIPTTPPKQETELDSGDPDIEVDVDPEGHTDEDFGEDPPVSVGSREEAERDIVEEEDIKNNEDTAGVSNIPPITDDLSTDGEGNFYHTLHFPEGNNIKANQDTDSKVPDVLPAGVKLANGTVSQSSPVMFLKTKKGSQSPIIVVGQVQQDGVFQPKWKQLGIIGEQYEKGTLFYEKFAAGNEALAGEDYVTYNKASEEITNIALGALTYDANGRAIINNSIDPSIVFSGEMAGSNPVTYTFGEEITTRGFIQDTLSKFFKGFGIKQANYSIKIYSNYEIETDPEIQVSGFTPKPGVPYLVIHNPKTENQVDVKTQFIRLTPRKLNRFDVNDGGFLKPLKDFYDAAIELGEKIFPNNPSLGLGDIVVNNVIRRMANAKNSQGTYAYEYDPNTKEIKHNMNIYTYEKYQEDKAKGYENLQGTEITEEQFNEIAEIAKKIIPLYYGKRYRNRALVLTEEEAKEKAKEIQDQDKILVKANSINKKRPDNEYYIKNKKVTKNDKETFEVEPYLAAGYGPAQQVMNQLAAANNAFKYRKKIRGVKTDEFTSKRLMSTDTSTEKARNTFIDLLLDRYAEISKDGKVEPKRKQAIRKSSLDELKVELTNLGIPEGLINQEIAKNSVAPISIADLETIVGNKAFDQNGDHTFADGQYLALPLGKESVNGHGKSSKEGGDNNLGKKESIDKIESMMGSKLEKVSGSKIVIKKEFKVQPDIEEVGIVGPDREEVTPIPEVTNPTKIKEVRDELQSIDDFIKEVDNTTDINTLNQMVEDLQPILEEIKETDERLYLSLQESILEATVENLQDYIIRIENYRRNNVNTLDTIENLPETEEDKSEETVQPFTVEDYRYSYEDGKYFRTDLLLGDVEEISKQEYEIAKAQIKTFLLRDGIETGADLTVEEATKLAQKILPGLKINKKNWLRSKFFSLLNIPISNEVELNFLDRVQFEALVGRKDALGVYINGSIYLLKDDKGTVKENVVRHELMHKIYWEHLSAKDRMNIRRSARRKNPETARMPAREFEEWLVDEFMVFRPENHDGRLRRLFTNLKRLFQFILGNRSNLETLFSVVNMGYFRRSTGSKSIAMRRFYIDIKKGFPNAKVFKDSVLHIQRLYSGYLDVSLDDPNKKVYEYHEIYHDIKHYLRNQSIKVNNDLKKNEAAVDKVKATNDPTLIKNLETRITRLKIDKAKIDALLGNDEKNYDIIVNYLFPDGFIKREWKQIKLMSKKDTKHLAEVDDITLSEMLDAVNLKDVIDDSKHIDNENKQSSAVKLLLSNVRDLETGEWINPRLAFAKLLPLMESISFEEHSVTSGRAKRDENFLSTLEEAIRQATGIDDKTPLNSAGSLYYIYRKLEDYYKSAYTPEYWAYSSSIPGKRRTVSDNIFFTNPDTLIISRDFSSKENYKEKSLYELNELKNQGKIFIITKSEAKRVLTRNLKETQDTTENIIKAYEYIINNEIQSGRITNFPDISQLTRISMLRESWRSEQSRNALAEFYSLFASMMEEQMRIAHFDSTANTMTYIAAGANSNSISVSALIKSGLVNKFTGLVDENSGDGKMAYSDFIGDNDWSKIESKLEANTNKERLDGISDFLTYLGVNVSTSELSISNPRKTSQDILKFVTSHMKSIGESITVKDEDHVDGKVSRKIDIYDIIDREGSFINRLGKDLAKGSKWVRSNSVQDTKGNRVYLYHDSTPANDILIMLSKAYHTIFKGGGGTRRSLKISKHLREPIYTQGNTFVNGLNKIHSTVEHDGIKSVDRDWTTGYVDESKKDWFSRVINASVVSIVNSSRGSASRYIQWVYTISNKPRLTGAEVNFLGKSDIKKSLGTYLVKLYNRPSLDGIIKNYKKYSNTNFSVLDKILDPTQDRNTAMQELISNSVKSDGTLTAYGNSIVDKMYDELTSMSREMAQQLYEDRFEFDARFMSAYKKLVRNKIEMEDIPNTTGLKVLDNGEVENYDGEGYAHSIDDIHQAVDMMFKNNYVNSYFLTDLVAGDAAFFKNALDVVKRMSGVFAPGKKGLVHRILGMKPTYRTAVMSDAVEGRDSIENSVSTMLFNKPYEQLSKEELDRIKPILNLYGNNYEATDGQGFITPERAEQLNKGFGRAFNAGNIFKGIHYEMVEKTFTDSNGNEFKALVPFMVKYSSVVLTDDLCNKHPELKKLRTKMRTQKSGAIDEVIFASANKVGLPVNPTDQSTITDEGTEFSEVSIYNLSNENFRLQSNPDHITYGSEKGVANPTQLGYMVLLQQHLMEGDTTKSSRIHEYTAKIVTKGLNKFKARLQDSDGKYSQAKMASFIKEAMTGKGNERYQELLAEGVSFQAPYIVNKALTQLASKLTKKTVGFRLPGEKLILQTSYKIQKKDGSRLMFKQNKDGHLEAEVIFPKGVLPKEVEADIEAMLGTGKEYYTNSDVLGFRIPSTELHSSVAIRIAGFYDSRGTNAIIAPKELVVLHGSDFDVDSLFVLNRSHYSDVQADFFNNGKKEPIGFSLDKKTNKYKLDINAFEKRFNTLKKENEDALESNPLDLKAKSNLRMLDEIEDRFFTNVITESFIELAVDPKNRTRMVEPISMEMFNGKGPDTVFTMLGLMQQNKLKFEKGGKVTDKELKEAAEIDTNIDLSTWEGNYKVFKSSMDGRSLTGVFANAFKSLAYMINSGNLFAENLEGKIARIDSQIKVLKETKNKEQKLLTTISSDLENIIKKDNPKSFARVSDMKLSLENSIKKLDEEIEGLEDSKKDIKEDPKQSKAPFIKGEPIRLLGITFNRLTEFHVDSNGNKTDIPVWRTLDSLINAAIDNVKEQILPTINATGLTSNAFSALIGLGVPVKTIVRIMRQPVIMGMSSVGRKSSEIRNKKEALVEMFDELQNTPGYDWLEGKTDELIEYMASQLELTDSELEDGFVKDNINFGKVSLGDIASVINELDNPLETIVRQYRILLEFEKAVNLGDAIASLSTATNIIRMNPNSKDKFSDMQAKWNSILQKNEQGERELNPDFPFEIPNLLENHPHLKAALESFDTLVDISESTFLKHNIKISELSKKLISKLKVVLGKRNETIEKVKDDFIKFIITGIPLMNTVPIRNSDKFKGIQGISKYSTGQEAWSQEFINKIDALKQYYLAKKRPNAFLENIAIRYGAFRQKYVQFTAGNNLKYEDILEFQEAFQELNTVEFKKGKVVDTTPSEVYTELQKDFVRFAIINFGLEFGSTNYSTSLPSDIVKPFIDEMVSELEEALVGDNIQNYSELFEIQLALYRGRNINKLRGAKLIQHEVSPGEMRSSGYDKVEKTFFNLKFKREDKPLPEYIRFGNGIFKKLFTSTTTGAHEFYTKIGSTLRRVNYFLNKNLLGKYSVDEAFDPSVLSRPVDNVEEATSVKIPKFYTVETEKDNSRGTVVMLYAFDDVARLDRKYFMLTDRKSDYAKSKLGFEEAEFGIRELTEKELADYQYTLGDVFKLKRKTSKVELNFENSQSAMGTIQIDSEYSVENMLIDIQQKGSLSGKLMANLLLSPMFVGTIRDIKIKTGRAEATKEGINIGYWNSGKPDQIFVATHYPYGKNNGGGARIPIKKIEKTFLHELLHAVTVKNLTRPIHELDADQQRARANIIKLYNLVQEKLREQDPDFDKLKGKPGKYYGFKNIKEFVAEAFSNEEFQAMLDSFEVGGRKKQTILGKFVKFIKQLLGKSVPANSLLSQVMNNTFFLIDSPTKDGLADISSEDIYYKTVEKPGIQPSETSLKILEDSKKIKVQKDTQGNELDTYKHEVTKNIFRRVSDNFTGFLSNFIVKKPQEKDFSYSRLKAERKWQGVDPEVKLPIDDYEEGLMDKEEYIKWLESLDEKGRVKGRIMHKWIEKLLHNPFSKKTAQQIDQELVEELSKSDVSDPIKTYGWIESNIDLLLERLGINARQKNISEDKRDKVFSEVTVGSDLLKYAGTMDMLVEHADGTYSIVDWKTGRSVEKEVMESLLRYGNQFDHMFDDPKTRNKLQVMFYAFMLKLENPDIQFRDLSLMWIPNKYEALAYDPTLRTNHANFLKMIEDFYRTEHRDTYEKILSKSPNAFNAKHYNASDSTLANMMLNEKKSAEQVLNAKQAQLKHMIQAKQDRRQMTHEDLKKIKELTLELVSFATMEGYDIQNWKQDISWGSKMFGQNSDVNHPLIALYGARLNEAKDKANAEYIRDRNKLTTLIEPVFKDYLKKKGLTNILRKLSLGKIDFSKYNEIYKDFYTTYEKDGILVERLLHNSETDEGRKKAYKDLTDNQKKLLDFLNERFGSFFEGPDAFLHRTAVVGKPNIVGGIEMNTKDLSDIELFNHSKNKLDRFEYHKGFLPVVAPTLQDMRERYKGHPMKYIKYLYSKYLTYSEEYAYEQWGVKDEAIPIKGLGTRKLRADRIYSRNLAVVFDRYMRSMYHKKYGDDVHALARGMQITAMLATEAGDKSNIHDYLDKHISMELYHKNQEPFDVTQKPLLSPFGGDRARKLSLLKMLQVMRSSAGAALMWLKPHKGAQNFGIAGLFTLKEAVLNDITKVIGKDPLMGLDGSPTDFGIKDLIEAGAIVATHVGHQIKGDFHKSKVWHLSEKLRFSTNSYELATDAKYLQTMKETLLSADVAYMFHTLPEEYIANVIMVAQMRRMKFTSGAWKGKSMWEAYSVDKDVNSSDYTLNYNGPVRAVQKIGKKQVEIAEITSKEAERMRYVYARIHGGYRQNEKTSMEWYVLGQAIIQFKKHLPGLLKANFGSKAESNVLGYYKPTLDSEGNVVTVKGEKGEEIPVVEWQKRITEGRWRTLAGMLGEYTRLNAIARGTIVGSRLLGENGAYRWDNLSADQKKNLIDGALVMGSLFIMWAAYGSYFEEEEDDDSLKKMAAYIIDTYSQNWNPIDIAKNLSTLPNSAAAARTYKTMSSATDLAFSMWATTGWSPFQSPDDAYTTNGDLQGWIQFKRGIPILASYYEVMKWLEGTDVFEDNLRRFE